MMLRVSASSAARCVSHQQQPIIRTAMLSSARNTLPLRKTFRLFSSASQRTRRELRDYAPVETRGGIRQSVENSRVQSLYGYEALRHAQETSRISLRPLFVAVAICTGSLYVADLLDRRADAEYVRHLRQSRWAFEDQSLESANRLVRRAKLQEAVRWLEGIHAPFVISQVGSSVLTWWYSLDDSRSATAAIIGINTLVYLAWRVPSPRLQMLMFRSFMHYPGQTSSYTLLTSVFSHMGLMHLAFNMMALYGFGQVSFQYLKLHRFIDYPNLDLERGTSMNINSHYHFVAIFMTFGVAANLLPHYVSLLAARSPALMASYMGPALMPRPGLGASGAVYGCLAVTALAHPELEVSLIFLPFIPLKLGYAFPAICAGDLVGLLGGFSKFGHLTHLTGAAAGAAAYLYGPLAWYHGQKALLGERLGSR